MRKLLALGLGLALAASLTASAFAGPSRAIVQELGAVVPAGEVNVDLLALSGVNAPALNLPAATVLSVLKNNKSFQANVGAFGGELRVSNNSVGYKAAVGPAGLALYGDLMYNNGQPSTAAAVGTITGTTQITVGAAYTTTLGGFILNLNPEYVSISQSNRDPALVYQTSGLNINAAALYPINSSLLIGGELLLNNFSYDATVNGSVNSATTIALGGRYTVNPNVTLDAAIYANTSTTLQGGGVAPSYSTLGLPAVVKLNVKF